MEIMEAYERRTYNEHFQKVMHERYAMTPYPVAKWILFCDALLADGFDVAVYNAGTKSKYVFVKKGRAYYPSKYRRSKTYTVRFGNHKPNRQKEEAGACDFFVGVTHLGVTRTEDAYVAVHKFFRGRLFNQCNVCHQKDDHAPGCPNEVVFPSADDNSEDDAPF